MAAIGSSCKSAEQMKRTADVRTYGHQGAKTESSSSRKQPGLGLSIRKAAAAAAATPVGCGAATLSYAAAEAAAATGQPGQSRPRQLGPRRPFLNWVGPDIFGTDTYRISGSCSQLSHLREGLWSIGTGHPSSGMSWVDQMTETLRPTRPGRTVGSPGRQLPSKWRSHVKSSMAMIAGANRSGPGRI